MTFSLDVAETVLRGNLWSNQGAFLIYPHSKIFGAQHGLEAQALTDIYNIVLSCLVAEETVDAVCGRRHCILRKPTPYNYLVKLGLFRVLPDPYGEIAPI